MKLHLGNIKLHFADMMLHLGNIKLHFTDMMLYLGNIKPRLDNIKPHLVDMMFQLCLQSFAKSQIDYSFTYYYNGKCQVLYGLEYAGIFAKEWYIYV